MIGRGGFGSVFKGMLEFPPGQVNSQYHLHSTVVNIFFFFYKLFYL